MRNGWWLGLGGLIFTLAGLIFTAGYQWSVIHGHLTHEGYAHPGAVKETTFERHIETLNSERVRLQAQLDRIQRNQCLILDELEIRSADCE